MLNATRYTDGRYVVGRYHTVFISSMLRSNMTPGNSAKLLTMEKMQTHGTFSESSDSSEDNSKQLRRDSSLCEQHPRSPVEIMSSIYNDITWSFSRDLMLCWLFYLFGVHGIIRYNSSEKI